MANKNKNTKKATDTITLSADTTAQINDKSPQQIMEDFVREKLSPSDPPDYKILQNKSHVLLQTEVLNHLNEGWTLVGGIALATYVTPYEASLLFSQALAKNI
jgi:hypothetical protein